RLPVIGDEDVRPAIAVKIGAQHAQSWPRQPAQSGAQRYILEAHALAVAAEVAVKARDRAGEGAGVTVIRPPAQTGAAERGVVIDIVGDDEIEPAVAVKVKERRRAGPLRRVDPRVFRHVGELAAAEVAEQ